MGLGTGWKAAGAALGATVGASAACSVYMVARHGTNPKRPGHERPFEIHRELFAQAVPATVTGAVVGGGAGAVGAAMAAPRFGAEVTKMALRQGAAMYLTGAVMGVIGGAISLYDVDIDAYPERDRGLLVAQQTLGYALPLGATLAVVSPLLFALR